MKRIFLTFLASCVALGGMANKFNELLLQYATDFKVNQLLFVRCTGGSHATIEYYVRDSVTKKWVLDKAGSGPGFIGKNGLGKTRAGDVKTPVGTFTARQAFGIKPNPGAKLKYCHVNSTTYGCGDAHFYNRIVDVSNPKYRHACKGEKMWTYVPQYNYGLETTYNDNNVVGKGAAIFIHVKGKYPYTGGCVSMDEDKMKHIVMTATEGIKICIYKDE